MFSHIILYMKFTQFIKEFRSAHPDLNMSFKECMQSDDIKGAYKNIIGAGLSQKPAKIAEPKPVQEILGKEAAVGEWKKPPQERGIKGGTKAKRGKDCPPCPPCDRRRCVGDKGKRGGGQQQQKEYKLKGKENKKTLRSQKRHHITKTIRKHYAERRKGFKQNLQLQHLRFCCGPAAP